MKTLCAPQAFACHADAFTDWLMFTHGGGLLVAIVLAIGTAWVVAEKGEY